MSCDRLGRLRHVQHESSQLYIDTLPVGLLMNQFCHVLYDPGEVQVDVSKSLIYSVQSVSGISLEVPELRFEQVDAGVLKVPACLQLVVDRGR